MAKRRYEKQKQAATDAATTANADTLAGARKALKEIIDATSQQRTLMLDDMRFCTLDQWPAEIRADREDLNQEGGPRPCLTIDKVNQYIVQIVNDMRQGRPGIVVRPQDDEADVETAKVLKGIIRNIEDQSNADIAYATAGENAVKIGVGYFRVMTEYVDETSDEQEIFIRPIPNSFSVYMGQHQFPDGSDSECVFVAEAMQVEKFKQLFPKAKADKGEFDGLSSDDLSWWRTDETITVVEQYYFERTRHTLNVLADGTTMLGEDYDALEGAKPTIVKSRSTMVKRLKWCKMSAVEVLDERDLPGKYIPVVEVIGRESWVEGKRILWGIVRPAKDSLRMYNYWASTITERMALAPKVPFIGAKGQFDGLEERWRQANRKNYAYLEYNAIDVNGNAIPGPQRQGPTPVEAALLQERQVIEHDVETSLGMFKAAVGQSESQQSGRAILALQRESDTGTYHFGANLGVSIRHAGKIILDMIPHYYDTKRVVRILGEDGEVRTAQIDPEQPQAMREVRQGEAIKRIYNPGVGKYDISITVGPSYNTKRMEAAATFVELAKGAGDPATAAVMSYLTVRNSDFNGAEEAAKMLRALLPPVVQQAVSENAPVPPQVQAQVMQMQNQMAMMEQAGQKLMQENQQLKIGAEEAAKKLELERAEAEAQLALQKQKQDAEIALASAKVDAELRLKRASMEADHGMKMEEIGLDRERQIAADPNFKDMSMMPQATEAMQALAQAVEQGFGQLAALLQQSIQIQQATLAAFERPKSVSIANVRKNGDGTIVGADIATTLN